MIVKYYYCKYVKSEFVKSMYSRVGFEDFYPQDLHHLLARLHRYVVEEVRHQIGQRDEHLRPHVRLHVDAGNHLALD